MGVVETESMEPFGVETSFAENVMVEGSEQEKNELKEVVKSSVFETEVSVLKENDSQVVNDSGVNNGVSSEINNDGDVEVVKSSVFETEVSILKENDSQVVADSEVNNGLSSLLKTGENDGSVVVCEKINCEEKVKECDEKIQTVEIPIVEISENIDIEVNGKENEEGKKDEKITTVEVPIVETSENIDVEMNEKDNEEGEKGEKCDGKIEPVEVPIVEASESVDVEMTEREGAEGKKDENCDGKIETVEGPIIEASESMDVEVDDLIDERCDFSVGDFVWGKIKSHPWWPGRVYDPSDASELALKLKQKNRLLVAYFDGTFAWCHPSQLKPFKDNFDDMVRQGSSKAFTYAVQEAVNEVGRVLVTKMSRSFVVAGETKSEFSPMLAKNSGIKEGVFVPDSGTESISAVTLEPAELLSQVKQIAEVIDIASVLELEILKARLSAFYISKGGYKLACYEHPKRVLGLEDKDDVNDAVEPPSQGPFEEDYSTLPLTPKSGSGSRPNRRRKQKSIADIMGEDKDVDAKDKDWDASDDEILVAIKSRGRKKKKDNGDAGTSEPVQKTKELLVGTDTETVRGGKESCEDKENSDGGKSQQSDEEKEAFGNDNISDGSRGENDEGKPKEPNEKGFLSRERKKSKYLSPPFTTSIRDFVKGRGSGPLSPRVSKYNSEAFQEFEFSVNLNHQTPDDENETLDPEKVKVPSAEILSKIRDAALSPQMSRKGTSSDRLVDFVSVMRSSLYLEGSLHKEYNEAEPGTGRKRKKPESELDQSDNISPTEDSGPAKKRKERTTSLSKVKKRARETETSGKKGTNGKSGGQHTERLKKSKPSQDKLLTPATPSLSQGTETSKLIIIQQKLQGLVSMVESSDDKSPDFKTKVESEVKGLLEDVNNMVESTSS